jgi:hypothetical protein
MRLWRSAVIASALLLALLALGAGVAMGAAASAITAREGLEFSGAVDTISCAAGALPTNVSIDWGDQSPASGGSAMQIEGGMCEISGTHTYAEEGTYVTQVTYNLGGGRSSDVGSATVSDIQPGSNSSDTINAAAGTAFSAAVATFTDPVPEPLPSYSATIDWGDGTSSPGAIGGGYVVTGSHTYVNGGNFMITVTIHDEGGAVATPHDAAIVSGCPSSAPSAPSTPFEPGGTGFNARYVEALFHDLLGRAPGQFELHAATQALSFGEARKQLVLWLLGSTEYQEDLVNGYYLRFLRRPGNPSDLAYFANVIHTGGTDQQAVASLLSSPEYFANRGNGSSGGFLTAMYCDAVFRPIDQPTQDSADNLLTKGTPREQVATNMLSSTEYLSQLVNGYYLRFLRRSGVPSDLAYFAGAIHNGGTDEQVIASLLSSPDYYALFNPTVKAVTTLSAQGTIHTTLSRYATLTMTVLRIVPAVQSAAAAFGAPHTKMVGVVDFGAHRKGRVTLHWNRKVSGRRLLRGSYVLLLHAYHGHKLIYVSDALPFRVR